MKVFKRYLPLLCAALLIIGSSMTVFASSLEFPSDYDPKYNYVVIKDSSKYYFVASTGNFYVNKTDGALLIDSGSNKFYTSSDMTNWKFSHASDNTTVYSGSKFEVCYSKKNIYYNDDTPFFPQPRVPVAKMAVPLGEMVQKQVGKILPVAVGCLALLIGSIVLLPRLRIFL